MFLIDEFGSIARIDDVPRDIGGQGGGCKDRGQKQKWYALRFAGEDAEIDIAHPAGGHERSEEEGRRQRTPSLAAARQRECVERPRKDDRHADEQEQGEQAPPVGQRCEITKHHRERQKEQDLVVAPTVRRHK